MNDRWIHVSAIAFVIVLPYAATSSYATRVRTGVPDTQNTPILIPGLGS